jgi:ubiquinone/menaquinone biosynthesis C-methylase UbiE
MQRWIQVAIDWLQVDKRHRVLDCGSGAGAQSLFVSREAGVCVSLDYSPPLLRFGARIGAIAYPVGGEAGGLPFRSGTFDRLLCFSVIFYFPDFEYARRALDDMLRVCTPEGRIVITDVPDAALKGEALRARQHPRHPTQHRSKADLQHLYYPRSFFTDVARAHGCSCTIVDHPLSGAEYENAPFRFNVIFDRSKPPTS